MFEQPRRLHYASILIGFGKYLRQAVWPLVVAIYTGFKSNHENTELIILLVLAVMGLLLLIGPILAYFSTSFSIQSDSLVIQSGFVWRKRRTIPLSRIQNVNIKQTVWHRMMGAAAVMVETAAGSGVEGQLDALSLEDANALQRVLLHQTLESHPEAEPVAPPELFSLTTKQILQAGALRNRGMYIIAAIAGVMQYGEFTKTAMKPIYDALSHTNPATGIAISILLAIGLVVVGWLLSIGYSALRFYGFRIERHDKGLMVHHGLLTQIKAIVPVGRVQQVRVVQPMFFRLFNFCEVFAYTAGSFDDKESAGASNLCPILPIPDIEKIGRLVFPDFAFFSLQWYRVSSKSVPRNTLRSFISMVICFGTPLAVWLKWKAMFALIPFAALSYLFAVLRYRYVGYALNERYIASRQGVFQKEVALMPIHRIQHYTLSQSLTQRWLGLANLDVFSAAATGAHITIHDLDYETALQVRERLSQVYSERDRNAGGGL